VLARLDGDAVAVIREDRAQAAPESPVKAAAASVTARLQILLAELSLEPAKAPAPEPAAEPVHAPEVRPPAPAPADEPEDLRAEVPPAAEATEFAEEPATARAQFARVAEPAVFEHLATEPEPAPDAAAEPGPEPSASEPTPVEDEPGPRIFIDDTAPFDFVPPAVQRIELEEGDGVLAVVSLVVLGLAFFAGGVFWALNAQPPSPLLARPGVFTPLMVGWLAGVTGVGFITVAVFMLLQRMTRAAERRDRRRI
jgi:hypothetical protein